MDHLGVSDWLLPTIPTSTMHVTECLPHTQPKAWVDFAPNGDRIVPSIARNGQEEAKTIRSEEKWPFSVSVCI